MAVLEGFCSLLPPLLPQEEAERLALSAPRAPSGFWTQEAVRAAVMEAEGRWTAPEVALGLGVGVAQVRAWRRDPAFREAVARVQGAMLSRLAELGFEGKARRASLLAERMEQIGRVVEERAASADSFLAEAAGVDFDEKLARAPGGGTGLVTRKLKAVGSGDGQVLVDEFEVDVASVRLEAELSRQLAGELGQWADRAEKTVTHKLYVGVDLEEV